MNSEEFKKRIFFEVKDQNLTNPFNPKLTELEINVFEKKYNVKIPKEYKFFLLEIGNGGYGPGHGVLKLEETVFDFKLDSNPSINLSEKFKYNIAWNELWIENFDWDNDRPELDIVNDYMNVKHIAGCLQISHYGHGSTNLIILKGKNKGEIWFDSRADYGGIFPEKNEETNLTLNFFDWYINWLNTKDEF